MLRTVATCETGGKRLELNDVTEDLRHRDVVNEVLKGDAPSVSLRFRKQRERRLCVCDCGGRRLHAVGDMSLKIKGGALLFKGGALLFEGRAQKFEGGALRPSKTT